MNKQFVVGSAQIGALGFFCARIGICGYGRLDYRISNSENYQLEKQNWLLFTTTFFKTDDKKTINYSLRPVDVYINGTIYHK